MTQNHNHPNQKNSIAAQADRVLFINHERENFGLLTIKDACDQKGLEAMKEVMAKEEFVSWMEGAKSARKISALEAAVIRNRADVIKAWMDDPRLSWNTTSQKVWDDMFHLACVCEGLNIIQWMTSREFKDRVGYKFDWSKMQVKGLLGACYYSHWNVVEYLTLSNEFKEQGNEWGDLHAENEYAFMAVTLMEDVKGLNFLQSKEVLEKQGPVNLEKMINKVEGRGNHQVIETLAEKKSPWLRELIMEKNYPWDEQDEGLKDVMRAHPVIQDLFMERQAIKEHEVLKETIKKSNKAALENKDVGLSSRQDKNVNNIKDDNGVDEGSSFPNKKVKKL